MKIDYLIVGQGLGGSLLAWHLLMREKRILVVDRDESVTSSKVAAGLVTPLAGSSFKISPSFEERLQYAKKFYWDSEESTGGRFFHHVPITRLFRNEEEASVWNSCEKGEESALSPYVGHLDLQKNLFRDTHGGFEMKGGGWLDVPSFLEATRVHLLERASYAIGRVDSEQVKTTDKGVHWRNIEASKVIFAEGWRSPTNRFFSWLEMRSALGDILEVKIDALHSYSGIVNRGAWLLPLGDGRFRTGSNYRHGFSKEQPDQTGRVEISKKLESITPHSYEITGHQCAIRPIIRRSQIFAGIHPTETSVAFFNGLGSKGVVNGPWHAQRLVELLEDGKPLPNESDIRGNLISS